METMRAEAVADGQAPLNSAEVVFKVISLDSSNSTEFKNAGLSTRSLKPSSAAEQELLEELAVQKQKKSCYHWRICWDQEEEWSSRGSAAINTTTLWGHEEAPGRESCRRTLLVSLLNPDPVITSGACGFWTILVVWWTICCVMVNYISVVCSCVMNYMWL